MNIFIDTQDMEERYGEQLYQDYLVEQNKNLQQENKQLKEDLEREIQVVNELTDFHHYRWNELKKWLEEQNYKDENGWFIDVMEVLNKIKELEEGVK